MVGKNVRREALLVKKRGYIGSIVAMTLYSYDLCSSTQCLTTYSAIEAERVNIGHEEGKVRLVV